MATSDAAVKIIPGTDFVVDGFKIKNKADYKHWFLTHFHSDHYSGITKTWKNGTIYGSQVTCDLVKLKLGVDAKILKPLAFDTRYNIEGVGVTLMGANHCPGSAIILFELPCGKSYLHTGDFRFNKELFSKYEPLKPYIKTCRDDDQRERKQLTAIYLDTTYCDPIYTFPKQTDAIQLISDIVKAKKRQGKRTLTLIGTYYIGKERIASKIAEECNCNIFVTIDKYKAIKCLQLKDEQRFVTNPALSDVHIVSMMHLGWSKLFENRALVQDKYDEIIAFRPTAWCFKELVEDSSIKHDSTTQHVSINFSRRANITLIDVPYSEHSSFSELRECVQLLDSKTVVPTVYKNQEHLTKILYYLSEQFNSCPINLKLDIPDELLNFSEKGSRKKTKQVKKDSTVRTLFDMAKKGVNFVKSFTSSFSSEKPKKLLLRKPTGTFDDSPTLINDSPIPDTNVIHDSSITDNSCGIDDSQQLEDVNFEDSLIDMESFDIELQKRLFEQYAKKESETNTVIVIDDHSSQSSDTIKEESQKSKKLNLKRKTSDSAQIKQPSKKRLKVTPPPQKTTLMSFWKK
jgi:hypothetical protein